MKIQGYEIYQVAQKDKLLSVYKAIRIFDRKPVLLKKLSRLASEQETQKFQLEYDIGKSIVSNYVINYLDYIPSGEGPVIIIEDCEGQILEEIVPSQGMAILDFLEIALQLIEGLHEIHQQHITLRHIKPANILWLPKQKTIKYKDLSHAAREESESSLRLPWQHLAEILPYCSPEQTGQVNRLVDYRADFYSLGITFYYMLYGKLPFSEQEDATKLLHAQLARMPTPLHINRPLVPEILSNIVNKLLMKDPDERYQSSYAIKADLEKCYLDYRISGQIQLFSLAQKDFKERFKINQKIYGREQEFNILIDAFENLSQKMPYVILLTGEAGVGKTALALEMQQYCTLKSAKFVTGKFENINRGSAYNALVQALQCLVTYLLSNEEKIDFWRNKIKQVLGGNGQLLVNLLPELESLIGRQKAISNIDILNESNLFSELFHNFLKLFAEPSCPFVLFLDDLQWADSASLNILTNFLSDKEIKGFLLIATYRINEIDAYHPFNQFLANLTNYKVHHRFLPLKNLTINTVNQWIAHTLTCQPESCLSLSKIVIQKTLGNPFYIKVFLQILYQENLLYLSKDYNWQWDENSIAQYNVMENMVNFILKSLNKLPKDTLEVLKTASCLGNVFKIKLLKLMVGLEYKQLHEFLMPALHMNFIYRFSDSYCFSHDKVHESVYQLMTDFEKKQKHLLIGINLERNYFHTEQEGDVFKLLDHINKASELLFEPKERALFARYNFQAAQKAKLANAYLAAKDYISNCLKLCERNLWEIDYQFAFSIYKLFAEIACLNAEFSTLDEVSRLTLARVNTSIEKSEIYSLLITANTLSGNYPNVIELGREALKLLEFDLPREPYISALFEQLHLVKNQLNSKTINDLLTLPEMSLPDKKAIMRLFFVLAPAAYLTSQELLAVISVMMVNLSLSYGNALESCQGYAQYGLLLCSLLKDTKSGYAFGKLAMQLSEQYNNLIQICRTHTIYTIYIHHWFKSLHELDTYWQIGYQAGIDANEQLWLGYLYYEKIVSNFYRGINLKHLLTEINRFLKIAERAKNQFAIDNLSALRLVTLNLLDKTESEDNFYDDIAEEEQYQQNWLKQKNLVPSCLLGIFKAQTFYLYGNYIAAQKSLDLAKPALEFIASDFGIVNYTWQSSLVLAAQLSTEYDLAQESSINNLRDFYKQLEEWAENCPENFLHKALTIKSELKRLEGKLYEALEQYDNAIKAAKQNNFMHDYALINELAAITLLKAGKNTCAIGYLQEAYLSYQHWGAIRKINKMKQQYSELLVLKSVSNSENINPQSFAILDLSNMTKVSHTISKEIDMPKLLGSIMKLMVETAGAQSGSFFLFEKQSDLVLQAEYKINDNTLSIPNNSSFSYWEGPRSIIEQVKAKQECVILNNASIDSIFSLDNYIIKHKVKSVMCMPIFMQNNFKGILYFENNLMSHAFNQERLTILNILALQMTISVENAKFVTEQINAMQEIADIQRARANEAENYRKNLESFIDMICHEIRNPLNGILGNADIMGTYVTELELLCLQPIDSSLKQKIKDYAKMFQESIEAIKTCAGHQKVIADDVLDLSKLEANKVELNIVPFHPKETINSIVSTFDIEIAKKKLNKIINLPEEDLLVMGDPNRLAQILINLLSNAVKFTHAGYIQIEAKYHKSTAFTEIEIVIKDSGIGMTEEEQAHLFNRFAQTSRKTAVQYGGSGLGLYITKNLINLMQGNISVKSQRWHGTTFTFTIKCNNCLEKTNNNWLHEEPEKLGSAYVGTTNTANKHILIVEDNLTNQKVLEKILKTAGYICDIVNNGAEALNYLEKNMVDLIFMDQEMPVMNGLEATQEIRKRESHFGNRKSIPIIGLSGNARDEYIKQALATGMNDYICKPFKRAELLYKLNSWLEKSSIPTTQIDKSIIASNRYHNPLNDLLNKSTSIAGVSVKRLNPSSTFLYTETNTTQPYSDKSINLDDSQQAHKKNRFN